MRSRHRRLAATALLLAAGLGACRPAEERGAAAAGEPQPGGTAVVGMRTDFGAFNPVTNTDYYSEEVMKYALFTPLVQYDEKLNVRPHLAESWEMVGDTGVVFRLRRDVRWHDGQPVTAEDVKFTFDLAKTPATASLLASAYLSRVHRAEVVDRHTIRFHFTPHAQALESFWWAPVPRHLLQGVAPGELRNAPFNRNPVGSGPYRFVEWRSGERLVLERNPDFPEGLGGPPHLERVVFRVIPEPATLLTELLTGRVHVDIPVEPDQASQIEANPQTELHAFPGRAVYYVGWNTRRAPFTDAGVRRAMALAINRQEIIDALLRGYGTPAVGPIPPWSPLFPKDVAPLPYDPQQAAQLLQGAGWVDRNGDGMRENAAGQPLRFTLMTSDRPLNRAAVEVVQAQLRRVGVDARIEVAEFQTMLAQHRGRNYDAIFTNWVLDNFQVASAPYSLFHSSLAQVPGSANRSSYANPRADAAIERGAVATDPEQARAAWRELLEILQQEQPLTFMFWLDELAASRREIQGVVMDPRGELVSIGEWWLAGGRRRGG